MEHDGVLMHWIAACDKSYTRTLAVERYLTIAYSAIFMIAIEKKQLLPKNSHRLLDFKLEIMPHGKKIQTPGDIEFSSFHKTL
jgi:hypothetical protein